MGYGATSPRSVSENELAVSLVNDPLNTIGRRAQPLRAPPYQDAKQRLAEIGLTTPVDHDRWFLCPTLTPLYYTDIYEELSEEQRRRYNQLTALCFNELIAYFESAFAAGVLAALDDARRRQPDDDLAECLVRFIAEERRHIEGWHQLNRLSEPAWYAGTDNHLIRIPVLARRVLSLMGSNPRAFPVVFWIMLALEEHGIEISRRCLKMDPQTIDPRYRMAFRDHLKDEVRHVQIDQQLIDRFYSDRPYAIRKFNAKLFGLMLGRFFLPPSHSAIRVIRRLVHEVRDLMPLEPIMIRQLRSLNTDPAYQEMMYSRKTSPKTFALMDRFPEMHPMRRVLIWYTPSPGAARDG